MFYKIAVGLAVGLIVYRYSHNLLFYGSIWASGIASLALIYGCLVYYRIGARQTTRAPRFKTYAFCAAPQNWSNALVGLAQDQKVAAPIFPDSFVLSDSLESLVEGLINQFVLSWYTKFSSDKVFPSTLDHIMRCSVAEIGSRASTVDWADFLVKIIMPQVSDHIRNYVKACASVKSMTDSAELPIALAEAYGQLHPAIGNKKFQYESARKDWLRGKLTNCLPKLFANMNPQELESPIVRTLLTEIVSCSVLFPLLSTLSDADFWNQTVVKLGADTLRDQSKVHKFRKALEAHIRSKEPDQGPSLSSGKRRSNNRRHSRKASRSDINLTPQADESDYDKFLSHIRACQTLADARQARYNISVQLKRMEKGYSGSLYEQRLQHGKSLLDKQIESLTGTTPPQDYFGKSFSSDQDPRESYSLTDVLNDSSCCQLFMDFMDQKHKTILLEFWLTANTLDRNEDPLGGIIVAEDHGGDAQSFIDTPDINEMYRRYFLNNLFVKLVQVDDNAIAVLADFAQTNGHPTVEQHSKARKVLFAAQDKVFGMMKDRELVHFKNSDKFINYLVGSSGHKKTPSGNIDQLQLVGEDDQEEDVVQAVQEAFEDIMGNESKEKRLRDKFKGKSERFKDKIVNTTDKIKRLNSPRESMDEPTRSSLDLPEESSGFRRRSVSKVSHFLSRSEPDLSLSSKSKESTTSKFDSPISSPTFDEKHSSSDEDSQFNIDEPEIHMAAPSDLGLTEVIGTLSDSIDRLHEQKDVVDMMFRKAELVNNRQDMRILDKSSSSLRREIQFKELQRQQYIVQESDNSLYGKSDIQIQSYMYANDKYGGIGYTLYFVEVSRFSEDGSLSAGWIVARRYSQFLHLHQHLREIFPAVRNLEFPKKRMLIKFQNRSQIDSRRIALEKYLKELLRLPQVCEHKEFRYFLSSESLDNRSDSVFATSGNLATNSRPTMASIGTTSSSSVNPLPALALTGSPPLIQTEGSPVIDDSYSGNSPNSSVKRTFVQPICDLFTQMFGLDSGDYSLRGRAIVVILSQLLGGTVEKRVREFISKQTSARLLTERVQDIRNSLWPNGPDGDFRQHVARSSAQKSHCKHEANGMVNQLIGNATSKLVGVSSSRYASRLIFGMYQNEILNAHLVYSIFDDLLDVLFPDIEMESANSD